MVGDLSAPYVVLWGVEIPLPGQKDLSNTEYASPVWCLTAESTLKKITPVHTAALRAATGAKSSTSRDALNVYCGVWSLETHFCVLARFFGLHACQRANARSRGAKNSGRTPAIATTTAFRVRNRSDSSSEASTKYLMMGQSLRRKKALFPCTLVRAAGT